MFFMLYIWDGANTNSNLPSQGFIENYQQFPLNNMLQRLI